MEKSLNIFIIIIFTITVLGALDYSTLPSAKLYFTKGSTLGIVTAIALPLETPLSHCYLAYNFKNFFRLPDNATSPEVYPPIKRMAKRFNRRILYKLIESKIELHGFPGRECLLRVICEASVHTFQHAGVLADFFHIIFTPSSSKEKGISRVYHEAEKLGKEQNCRKYNEKCNDSLLDLFSYIGDVL